MTEPIPTLAQIVQKIDSIKTAKGLTWVMLAEMMGHSPVWVAAAMMGQCSMSPEDCASVADLLELTEMECKVCKAILIEALWANGSDGSFRISFLRDYADLRRSNEASRSRRIRRRHHECN